MLDKPFSCLGCPLYGNGKGFVPCEGGGKNGVLLVLEAAGADEAAEGRPTIGKAGHYLWSQLARVGLERDDFRIHNVLSCQPNVPGFKPNFLAGAPYEVEAINHCSPNLDNTIREHVSNCSNANLTPVIVTLGKVAFKRVLDLDNKHSILREDYLCYPFWSQKYKSWVLAGDHPSYIMRGNHHLVPMLQFLVKRAVEIATDGITIEKPYYELDPDKNRFNGWVDGYFRALAEDPSIVLSYDIETPGKAGKSEDSLAKEETTSFRITRCSFCYRSGDSVSVEWDDEHMEGIRRLFASPGAKVGWNNNQYDDPRIKAQIPMVGDLLDGMLAWHVLNTAFPKGLGFVTPFYWKTTPMWKHLADQQPSFYNAKDADAALRNWIGIEKSLKSGNLWHVFDRHIVQVNRCFQYMSDQGVLVDLQLRHEQEQTISTQLKEVEEHIELVIPNDARDYKIYKKEPKDVTGLVQVRGFGKTTRCPSCGLEGVKSAHFKSVGKKKVAKGTQENPCAGRRADRVQVSQLLWARPLEFKISKTSLTRYQKVMGHKPIYDKDTRNTPDPKVTFDEKAIIKLQKIYPKDSLYPLILKQRGCQKLLGTYLGKTNPETGVVSGGLPIGPDGRIHTTFTRDPETLRSASKNPNMQNLVRGIMHGIKVRDLIVAKPGHIFVARDYSGIEAVLVGYFAQSARYIRLAKLDVHSYYTAYALNQLDGRVKSSDLPDIDWPDEKLIPHLAWLKKTFKEERNNLYKHLVHGANFMQGPLGAKEKILLETGIDYPVQLVSKVMKVYFELFPEIKKWHHTVLEQVERDGFIRNPFSYVQRFSKVFDYENIGGIWHKEPGPDANKVIASGPQSSAAGIITEAMLRLYQDRFEEAGQYLRLLVHDELLLEVPEDLAQSVDKVLVEEMEKPIPEFSLPPSWGMGSNLVILTEGKIGQRWGSMQ